MKPLQDLQENYELEIERIIKEIKSSKAKRVLLQFPDGFKPYAPSIVNELEKLTNNKVVFFIPFRFEPIEDNGLWRQVPYPGSGFSEAKKTKNTKYTAKYINNLYNKIQEDAN